MTNTLLKEVIELLHEVRSQWHDDHGTCTVAMLDEAIQKLEQLEQSQLPDSQKAHDALKVIGEILTRLPQICSAIEKLLNVFGD